MDGWLLYDFRGSNPVALHVAGIATSGSRRWFLWIPATGEPRWLIHAIEGSTFRNTARHRGRKTCLCGLARTGNVAAHAGGRTRRRYPAYCHGIQPRDPIPYVSRVDAGTKELVEQTTHAQIVSSANLVQLAQAISRGATGKPSAHGGSLPCRRDSAFIIFLHCHAHSNENPAGDLGLPHG